MAAIVFLDSLRNYAVTRNGTILEISGRTLWASETDLRDDARDAGVSLPGCVIDTRTDARGPRP